MKKTIFAIACAAGLLLMAPGQASAQADIEIGKTTIRLQSPVKIYGQDKNVYRYDDYGTRRKKNRWYDDASVFFGFSFPVEGCSYEPTAAMPVKYGNSFEITLGAKQWFGIGHYAFGISAQYTHYDYRGSGLAARGIITQYPHNAVISREIFKTDNIGIGVYNRFYISLRTPLYIDLGAWGDWAFSRQYKVKYYIGDYKEVDHYRDGEKFLPLQGGVYAAVGVNLFSIYCKYRFTHWFSHSVLPMEPPAADRTDDRDLTVRTVMIEGGDSLHGVALHYSAVNLLHQVLDQRRLQLHGLREKLPISRKLGRRVGRHGLADGWRSTAHGSRLTVRAGPTAYGPLFPKE